MKPYRILFSLALALLATAGMAAAAGLGAEAVPKDASALPELPSIESGDDQMLNTTLQLGYSFHRLGPQANPDEKDVVRLRSYNGQLIGPTLRVRPGDHPHVHGATAIQVGSGAVGALIVEGSGLDLVPEIRAARGLCPKTEKEPKP